LKVDDFAKSYSELAKVKADADQRAAAVPAKADDYKLELPSDMQLPEGMKVQFDEKDPRVVGFRQTVHDLKLDQAAASRLLGLEAQRIVAEETAAQQALEAEKGKLGDKAVERISAVDGYLKANLPAEQYQALQRVSESAAAIQAIESLIAKASAGTIPSTPPNSSAQRPVAVPMENRWYPEQKAS
jgi:hypothetical protein